MAFALAFVGARKPRLCSKLAQRRKARGPSLTDAGYYSRSLDTGCTCTSKGAGPCPNRAPDHRPLDRMAPIAHADRSTGARDALGPIEFSQGPRYPSQLYSDSRRHISGQPAICYDFYVCIYAPSRRVYQSADRPAASIARAGRSIEPMTNAPFQPLVFRNHRFRTKGAPFSHGGGRGVSGQQRASEASGSTQQAIAVGAAADVQPIQSSRSSQS